jgi:curved DNA-binding protein CbpA
MNDYYAVLGIEKNAAPDEIKAAYRFLVMQLHPDKHQGQGQGARIAEKKFKEITEAYEILSDDEKRAAYDKQNHGMDFQNQTWTYQRADTNTGAEREAREQSEKEAREQRERGKRERREQQEKEQSYYRQEPYNDYVVDREIPYESKSRQTESSNTFIKLLVGIIAFVIFVHIVQSCPTKKEPNRTPSPRVEYVLPKSEGSSITVNSDILTKYFGISYEQRQRSNLFMKDSHEYRYNGNGTWTITKKSAVNNTNKNYIDTNSKTDVENYLHGLGF